MKLFWNDQWNTPLIEPLWTTSTWVCLSSFFSPSLLFSFFSSWVRGWENEWRCHGIEEICVRNNWSNETRVSPFSMILIDTQRWVRLLSLLQVVIGWHHESTRSLLPPNSSAVFKRKGGKKRLSPRIPQCYSLIMKARTQHQQQQQQQQNGWKAKRKLSSRSLVVSSSDVWIGMVTIQKWDFPFCDFSAEENEHPNHCQFSRCSSLPEQRFYLIFLSFC